MGRTSKFTFPVPGRRQKHHSTVAPPVPSGPLSKAQRILGATELNIDAPRQWDETSASGISVSVSDRTSTTRTTERSHGRPQDASSRAAEEYNGHRATRNVNRWEMESETVPAYVQSGRGLHADDTNGDYMSDASSLRRRQSNSTLKSWYDKSKMPLSISQQTSSSAMAKGLPSKASALLDVDGGSDSMSTTSTARMSKRPSRLNLAHLFSGSRHRDSLQPSPSTASLRSQDFSRSPSIASSATPDTYPPSPRTPRRLLKKPTKERLAEAAAAAAAAAATPRPRSSSTQGGGGAVHCPRDLYDHYERTAFRNVLESPAEEEADPLDDEAATTRMLISDFPAAPVGPTALKSPPSYPRRSTVSNPVIKEPQRHEREAAWTSTEGSTKSRQSTAETLPSLDHDYPSSLASVSSRHTKTSKASKHTTASISESDRQERSVLCLSSDSEEDVDELYADTAAKAAPSVSSFSRATTMSNMSQQQQQQQQQQRDTPPSPASASRKSVRSRGESVSDTASRKSGKRASFATTNTYLTVPGGGGSPSSLKPTAFNPRTSSVSKASTGQQPSVPAVPEVPAIPSRITTRTSPPTATSTTSSSLPADWPRPSSSAKQPYGVHEAKAVTVHSVASTAQSLSGVDVPPQPDSTAQSIRSGDQPTPPLSPSSVEFCLQPDMSFDVGSSNPRLMAVTRQEQMLLAALRNKRAMMRENILAEFEGENQQAAPSPPRHRHTSSQATIRAADDQRALRHQGSGTSSSTVRSVKGSTKGSAKGSVKSAHARKDSRHASPAASVSTARQARTQPSPELSDFMDFDNGASESEDDRAEEAYMYRRAAVAASLRSGSSSSKSGSARRRPDSKALDRTLAPPGHDMTRKKAVRLSAVGTARPEADCWGDDG